MPSLISIAAALALLALLASRAGAQSTGVDAKAAGPAPAVKPSAGAGYRSAFDGYRRFTDQAVGSWRGANDEVSRIGGWRAYAREAQAGDGAPAAGPGPAAAAVKGHAGHHAP